MKEDTIILLVVLITMSALLTLGLNDLREKLNNIDGKVDVFLNNYGTEGVPPRKDLI